MASVRSSRRKLAVSRQNFLDQELRVLRKATSRLKEHTENDEKLSNIVDLLRNISEEFEHGHSRFGLHDKQLAIKDELPRIKAALDRLRKVKGDNERLHDLIKQLLEELSFYEEEEPCTENTDDPI
jgi:archaellum component FlaC